MKGISPVIAAVVLIAISVAVGVLLSGWVTQFVSKETEIANSCVTNTNYKIDSATYSTATQRMTVMITNLNTMELYGFSVQMQNTTHIVLYNYTEPDFSISPNVSKTDPLKDQRSAIIIVDMNGTKGDYGNLAYTATELKVLNSACPTFSIKTSQIEKE